MFVPDKLTLLV